MELLNKKTRIDDKKYGEVETKAITVEGRFGLNEDEQKEHGKKNSEYKAKIVSVLVTKELQDADPGFLKYELGQFAPIHRTKNIIPEAEEELDKLGKLAVEQFMAGKTKVTRAIVDETAKTESKETDTKKLSDSLYSVFKPELRKHGGKEYSKTQLYYLLLEENKKNEAVSPEILKEKGITKVFDETIAGLVAGGLLTKTGDKFKVNSVLPGEEEMEEKISKPEVEEPVKPPKPLETIEENEPETKQETDITDVRIDNEMWDDAVVIKSKGKETELKKEEISFFDSKDMDMTSAFLETMMVDEDLATEVLELEEKLNGVYASLYKLKQKVMKK